MFSLHNSSWNQCSVDNLGFHLCKSLKVALSAEIMRRFVVGTKFKHRSEFSLGTN